MVAPGKGLLACDESTGTVGTRLESIGLENNEENRRTWRQLLFDTPNIGDCISGAILFEETLYQDSNEGTPFVEVLNKAGIIPGIKVDTGLKPLCGGGDTETWCSGLDGLYEKCCAHYEQGARFAKWRTALRIDLAKGFPTDYAIDEAAHGLSRYARICQEAGLVPIVEPEILIDGDHDIYSTARIQERVITTVYKKLAECGVMLEGTLLKPSMTVCGVDCEDKPAVEEIARLTVQTFTRSIPAAVPGVTFLSGGSPRKVPRPLRGGCESWSLGRSQSSRGPSRKGIRGCRKGRHQPPGGGRRGKRGRRRRGRRGKRGRRGRGRRGGRYQSPRGGRRGRRGRRRRGQRGRRGRRGRGRRGGRYQSPGGGRRGRRGRRRRGQREGGRGKPRFLANSTKSWLIEGSP